MSAPCSGQTELFFSELDEDIAEAVAVCRVCPVAVACLDGAVRAEGGQRYLYGVFGGRSAADRRRNRRNLHTKAGAQ